MNSGRGMTSKYHNTKRRWCGHTNLIQKICTKRFCRLLRAALCKLKWNNELFIPFCSPLATSNLAPMPENSRLVATASAARDVLAFGACFTPGNAHVVPSPVRAGTTGTEDIDVGRTALDGAGHAVKCEIGDWDAASWCSGWAAVLIILLDDNTVIGDSREGDILLFSTVEDSMVTLFTVLSLRPPTEPMLRPCPPEQVPPVKVMSVPELMARQS